MGNSAPPTGVFGAFTPITGSDARLPGRLTPDEQRVLASVAECRVVLAGQELFQRGEEAQSMFLIDSGEVRLCFEHGLADKLLGPGQFFGELAVFIGRHQRLGRAVIESDAVLHEITQEAFGKLLEHEPRIAASFMQRSFTYLVAGEHQLVQGLSRRNEDLLRTLDTLRQTRSELTIVQQLVRTDDLTGLANRRGLYRFIDDLTPARITESGWALLLIDIDKFKGINDRNGHLAGDAALRAVAEEVRRQTRAMELPCRLGGDEFALLLQAVDEGDLANRAISLMAAVRSLRLPSLEDHSLTISVGGTFCSEPCGWSTWYSKADTALLESKRQGGDYWHLA